MASWTVVALVIASIGCVTLKSGDVAAPDGTDASLADGATPVDAIDEDGDEFRATETSDAASAQDADSTERAAGEDARDATIAEDDGDSSAVDATDALMDTTDGGTEAADALTDATIDSTDAPGDSADADAAGDGGSDAPVVPIVGEAANANPIGYVRSDGISAVVYRNAANDVGEIESKDGISWTAPKDLSQLGGATTTVLGNVVGDVRSDGTSDVVYLGADNDIHHIELGTSGWKDANLSGAGGAKSGIAMGDPHPYVRSDGVSAVVYRSADNDVHELTLVSGGWKDSDLSIAVGAPAAGSDPCGPVGGDQIDAVVYRGLDSHIRQIGAGADGGTPNIEDLSATSVCDSAQGTPHSYLRSDGLASIVYRDSVSPTPAVWEIVWYLGSWICYDVIWNSTDPTLGFATGGDPMPFVRADHLNSVIYRLSNDHIFELYLPVGLGRRWVPNDLTQISGAPGAASDPMGYIRADGTTAIVYRGRGDNHTRELALTATGWKAADLGP